MCLVNRQGDPDVQDLRDLWVEGRGQLMLSITAKIEAEIDERAADEMSFFMDPFWRSSSDQPVLSPSPFDAILHLHVHRSLLILYHHLKSGTCR